MSTDTSSALDQPTGTAPTPKPPRDKVMRIATMTKQLLDEIRTQPLDTAGLNRLRTIDSHIIGELHTALTPDLREELQRLALPLTQQAELSDAELRLAHAQLVGWLQGLLKTTHTALSDPHTVPVADWITDQAAEDAPTSSDIPTSPNHPDRPHLKPSKYLPDDVLPDEHIHVEAARPEIPASTSQGTEDVAIGQVMTGDMPQRVGRFWFYFDDERWEWSPEVAAIHGYEPGTVTPTTALVLSHKHPDDYQHVAATLDAVRRDHQAFSTRHRIIDTHGQVHHVVVVAEQLADDTGAVIGTNGFYVDITPALRQHHEQRIDAAVAEIAENRASIEQAKGMLMLAYGIDADAAFGLLRWQSQENNVKLRLLAEQIVRDYLPLAQAPTHPHRAAYDHALLTAHERIPTGATSVPPSVGQSASDNSPRSTPNGKHYGSPLFPITPNHAKTPNEEQSYTPRSDPR